MGIFDSKSSSDSKRRPSSQKPKKVVVSVTSDRSHHASTRESIDARDIIQDARDEAFRIKKGAEHY